MSSTTECIGRTASNRIALEEQLEAVHGYLQQLAMATKTHGILVTRHRADHYTASLSSSVPFGVTLEVDL
ncbi:hypothetical protein [Arthrobacter sp. S2(2024)]|uniref:hypothetical protein n=1 Tax=Arthrobacter sp. S2(2024) TaxID=3111911 RepID=UPI002FC85FAF